MLSLLLAAAAPPVQPAPRPAPRTAVDAERAFAEDATTLGQWTAFRKWAARDAVMFWPQPGNMHDTIAGWPDPARAVEWRPVESFVSCDGATVVNTGSTRWPDGARGYFTTVWRRGDAGWRWTVDHGERAVPFRPTRYALRIRKASCAGTPTAQALTPPEAPGVKVAYGRSADRTLQWHYRVDGTGARRLAVALWDGRMMETVIDDRVAAPVAAAKP